MKNELSQNKKFYNIIKNKLTSEKAFGFQHQIHVVIDDNSFVSFPLHFISTNTKGLLMNFLGCFAYDTFGNRVKEVIFISESELSSCYSEKEKKESVLHNTDLLIVSSLTRNNIYKSNIGKIIRNSKKQIIKIEDMKENAITKDFLLETFWKYYECAVDELEKQTIN
ncbi:hypothetical protein [Flavobacterium filum]|uniref:hypothetical protein n=1 Tax=Flavobacterium filum TaxID=370974 RepID=UPI0023F15B7F|nr:hypothetical protein [Flavobacterium filum]